VIDVRIVCGVLTKPPGTWRANGVMVAIVKLADAGRCELGRLEKRIDLFSSPRHLRAVSQWTCDSNGIGE